MLFLKPYRLFTFLLAAALTTALAACEKDPEPERLGSLQLSFENTVNNQPLVLENSTYSNANGDAFTVSAFKYYISNIRLRKADGSEYVQPESYYLIDHAVPATKNIQIGNVPAGEYTGISFIIGVDSTRNVSGAQTGALDPLHGMFWTWSSGYIFLKMEGTSPQSQDGHLTYHIGGFKAPANAIRTVSPDLKGEKFSVSTNGTAALSFKADVAELFKGPNLIRFAEFSAAMGGPAVLPIADNYTNMITFDKVQQ